MELNLFGGTGFIGSHYNWLYGTKTDTIARVPRFSSEPVLLNADYLYLISTVDNYNVFIDPGLDIETNLVVLAKVLKNWKEKSPGSVFNFISSWFVYGNTHQEMAKEYTPCDPKGFYSITKHCAEQLIESYAETFGLKYRILRLSNIIGTGAPFSAKKNALQYLIDKIQKNQSIELYDNGQFFRNFMNVEDCCRAIRLVMVNGELNTIYNIGGENVYFWDAIRYAIKRTQSKSIITNIEPKEFHRKVQAKNFRMDTKKLESLGFKCKYTFNQTINQIIEGSYYEH